MVKTRDCVLAWMATFVEGNKGIRYMVFFVFAQGGCYWAPDFLCPRAVLRGFVYDWDNYVRYTFY